MQPYTLHTQSNMFPHTDLLHPSIPMFLFTYIYINKYIYICTYINTCSYVYSFCLLIKWLFIFLLNIKKLLFNMSDLKFIGNVFHIPGAKQAMLFLYRDVLNCGILTFVLFSLVTLCWSTNENICKSASLMVLNINNSKKYWWSEFTFNRLYVENISDVEWNFATKNIYVKTLFCATMNLFRKEGQVRTAPHRNAIMEEGIGERIINA